MLRSYIRLTCWLWFDMCRTRAQPSSVRRSDRKTPETCDEIIHSRSDQSPSQREFCDFSVTCEAPDQKTASLLQTFLTQPVSLGFSFSVFLGQTEECYHGKYQDIARNNIQWWLQVIMEVRKRQTNVGDGGEKSASGMEESQEGKHSNSGGKESINTGNYS